MTVNFQQVRQQVEQMGGQALAHARHLRLLRESAGQLLLKHAAELDWLRSRVELLAEGDPNGLRCALPLDEALDARTPLPALPGPLTALAADGSQISLDRHAEAPYCLVNVGAIRMRIGAEAGESAPPQIVTTSRLIFGDDLYGPAGMITEAELALRRDLSERGLLADLAEGAAPPVVTFTDGPMELWGAQPGGAGGDYASRFQQSLQEYIAILRRLRQMDAVTAGYVDRPGAGLVVRLVEAAEAGEAELNDFRHFRPFQLISDADLYAGLLAPGERSAVFALQFAARRIYAGELELHFFFLNVGEAGAPWIARVEAPAWVTRRRDRLDALHAVLAQQCRVLGGRAYPYLLHRAHETAVVTLEEKTQVTGMIVQELLGRGLPLPQKTHKQALKDSAKRRRYP
jgi:hypothetical protein